MMYEMAILLSWWFQQRSVSGLRMLYLLNLEEIRVNFHTRCHCSTLIDDKGPWIGGVDLKCGGPIRLAL